MKQEEENKFDQKSTTITVGELRRHLSLFSDETEISFGNDNQLTFYRVKQRGPNYINLEFNELIVKVEK